MFWLWLFIISFIVCISWCRFYHIYCNTFHGRCPVVLIFDFLDILCLKSVYLGISWILGLSCILSYLVHLYVYLLIQQSLFPYFQRWMCHWNHYSHHWSNFHSHPAVLSWTVAQRTWECCKLLQKRGLGECKPGMTRSWRTEINRMFYQIDCKRHAVTYWLNTGKMQTVWNAFGKD